MPRHKNIIRSIPITTAFPEDVRAKLDLLLWSDAEGRIPQGAYQKFLLARIEEFFAGDVLDLGDFVGIVPKGRHLIRSSRQNIEQLKLLLARD